MERNQVLEEYWGLRKLLNLGNKVANERSEISFIIEELPESEYRMLATAISKNEIQKIELVRRDQRRNWERSGYTKFKVLENYCANFLNTKENENTNNFDISTKRYLSDIERERLAKSFQIEMDQLLIPYEF